ncbi:hypothetical protein V6N11_055090 [Hibiscus sabdariffa]|uniref:Uncharacterized protein n=2 Tax=Hibiscus sabdariffa TaxID=183260 RepID=A0ABR1ZPZ7_9ROSI
MWLVNLLSTFIGCLGVFLEFCYLLSRPELGLLRGFHPLPSTLSPSSQLNREYTNNLRPTSKNDLYERQAYSPAAKHNQSKLCLERIDFRERFKPHSTGLMKLGLPVFAEYLVISDKSAALHEYAARNRNGGC